jgi:hypothetical protein
MQAAACRPTIVPTLASRLALTVHLRVRLPRRDRDVWQARRVYRTRTSLHGRTGVRRRRALWGRALVVLMAIAVAGVAAASLLTQGGQSPGRTVASMFQDDQLLLYDPTATVKRTLATLRGLGVDRLRLTIEWYDIAPDNTSPTPPPHFNATDPADYPSASWAPYDRIVTLARQYGIGVDFDLSDPGPLWAMAPGANPAYRYVSEPSAREFGEFAQAVGRRYDGTYEVGDTNAGSGGALAVAPRPLPRVSFWSIWNEPNQPGWLAPQWRRKDGTEVELAPALYRSYVDAAWEGLAHSSHVAATDTILIGELAPEGCVPRYCIYRRPDWAIPPMSFLRALYCVGADYQPLRGAAASAAGCAASPSPGAFVRANPGLFDATGFADHPYELSLPPSTPMDQPGEGDFVPLSELGRLEDGLDRTFAAYGVGRQLPLYLTEYGYETNPPNPIHGFTLAQQSAYIDEAEYLAWKDPRVRALSQFLLQDAAPDRSFPRGSGGYWSTFQTGLEFLGGRRKPSFAAYRLPIWLPQQVAAPGGSLLVWGMLRLAPNRTTQTARVQWRTPHGGYRTIATVTTSNPSGFLETSVTPPASGTLRLAWTSADGRTYDSRAVAVTVR